MTRTRLRGRLGQAAVEGLLSIPVLMVLFMIGFEVFGLAWDAQYVDVKARYNAVAMEDARFRQGKPCLSTSGQQAVAASVTYPAHSLPLIGQVQSDIPLTSYAVIECNE